MPASIYDIDDLEQGSTFQLDVTVTDPATGSPLDLTGYLVRSKARKRYEDAEAAWTFTTTVATPTSGVISLSLTATQTAGFAKGTYVYDLELENVATGVVVKLIKGRIKVTPEATK